MHVALIDYGSGNLRSAEKALLRAGAGLDQAVHVVVTCDPDTVSKADRVVLPGVGAFADCKAGLDALSGMVDAVTEVALQKARPFLGICVGMQLFAERGLEFYITAGLGWIGGDVAVIDPADKALKIPHMGWNTLRINQPGHPVLADLDGADLDGPGGSEPYVYFVHSYAITPTDNNAVAATTNYGGDMVSAVGVDNIFGTQFHPEKSQANGLRLLENFLRWKP